MENINWKSYSHLLNIIFFSESDCIPKGTKEYDKFWDFVPKYQKMCSMKKGQSSKYDKFQSLNFQLNNNDADILL